MNGNKKESSRYVASKWVDGKRYFRESRKSQAEADRKLSLLLQSLMPQRSVVNVRDAFEAHIKPRWKNLNPRTQARYRACFAYIDKYIGDCPLPALNAIVAQDFVYALQATMVSKNGKGTDCKPMANATVRNIFHMTAGWMEILSLLDVIAKNPFTVKVVSLPKAPLKRERYLDIDSALKMLETVPADFYLPVWFASVLGLREGEIAGLQWSKLDRVQRRLRIDVQRTNSGTLDRCKHDSSRVLGLPQSFVDHIDRHGNLDSEFICTNPYGRPWRNNKIYYRWKSIRDGLGMPEWTFHDLRHCSAGLLTYMVDEKTAQTVLGHTSLDTTTVYIAQKARESENGFDKLAQLARR